jgi:hypothetical protein
MWQTRNPFWDDSSTSISDHFGSKIASGQYKVSTQRPQGTYTLWLFNIAMENGS